MKLPITVLIVGTLAACSAPPPPPENLGHKLAILPVNNRTGDPLAVSGTGLLDRYVFHTGTATVGDVLEGEAAFQLREKGFEIASPPSGQKLLNLRVPKDPSEAAEVAAQAGIGPLCLYFEIRRWEPEGRAHVNFVTVDFETSLVDTRSRQVVWKSARRGPIATPGQFLVESAYIGAARKVIQDVLAPLVPSPSP